jgi:hypothetical protein
MTIEGKGVKNVDEPVGDGARRSMAGGFATVTISAESKGDRRLYLSDDIVEIDKRLGDCDQRTRSAAQRAGTR